MGCQYGGRYSCVDRAVRWSTFGGIPWGELVLSFHVFHDFLQRLFLLDVHAIAYLLLVLPVVNHLDGCAQGDFRTFLGGFECAAHDGTIWCVEVTRVNQSCATARLPAAVVEIRFD